MDGFVSPHDIKLLADLIYPGQENDSSDDEEHVTKKATNTYLSPADLSKKSSTASASGDASNASKPEDIKKSQYEKIEERKPKTMLDYEDEYTSKIDELTDESKWKTTPTYDISYRQAVSASDVYLQMGNKTPATSSCENMIVAINLPEELSRSIDLKIEETSIKLSSSKYYIKLPLPQPVHPSLDKIMLKECAVLFGLPPNIDHNKRGKRLW